MNNEIINVLDNLAQKFGLAIDWTSQNIMPYLQELMNRFIKYKITTDTIWLIFGVAMFILSIILFKKLQKWKKSDNFDTEKWNNDEEIYFLGIFVLLCLFIAAITIIICFANGIIQSIFIPELTVIKYLRSVN